MLARGVASLFCSVCGEASAGEGKPSAFSECDIILPLFCVGGRLSLSLSLFSTHDKIRPCLREVSHTIEFYEQRRRQTTTTTNNDDDEQ